MIEYRTVNGGAVGADGGLTGMVTPFGVETVIGDLRRDGFREEIAPGTFTKTLQERAVVLIHDHKTAMPLASTAVPEGEEGHLSLTQERDGLWARAPQPVDTTYASDVRNLAKAGILGMSFGFEVTKDDWFDDEGRASNAKVGTKRVIREVKLHECTTTAFPAYGSTMGTVSARDSINAARGVVEARKAEFSDHPNDITYRWDEPAVEAVDYILSKLPEDKRVGSAGEVAKRHGWHVERADNKPYGDVTYADPKNGKYPVDTKKHAVAAWDYIHVQKNADEYPLNGVSLASVKAKIKAALVKFGVEVSEEKETEGAKETRTVSAEVDATLDAAFAGIASVDRNSLPAEVNQFIDLASAALKLASGDLKDSGIPDPDNPNGNDYSEAGSATSDDEGERADMALFAEHIRLMAEF